MTTSSAPGKIILLGEHAVVYNRPALAIPVMQVQANVEVRASSRAGIWITAPAVHLHAEVGALPSNHPIAYTINHLVSLFHISPLPSLEISINSTIPVAAGLGSGAAVSVALIRALSCALSEIKGTPRIHPLSDEQVNHLAYEVEKLHHGTPSGIDNTVITYVRPVFFIKNPAGADGEETGGKVETFKAGAPFIIVIGDTGIPAPTREAVSDVRRLWQTNQTHWESIFDEIGRISLEGRRAIESGDLDVLGELMDHNHALLQELTVSSPELDKLVNAAHKAGALGAKMSGSGRGGNMIALVTPDWAEAVSRSVQEAGARNVIITKVI